MLGIRPARWKYHEYADTHVAMRAHMVYVPVFYERILESLAFLVGNSEEGSSRKHHQNGNRTAHVPGTCISVK